MRRIKMILAVAAAMAVMVTAAVAPAMADNKHNNNNNNNDRNLDQRDIRLDHRLLNQNDNCCFNNNGFDDGFGFNDFNNGCFPFSFDSPFCDNFNNFDSSTHGAISGATVNITR